MQRLCTNGPGASALVAVTPPLFQWGDLIKIQVVAPTQHQLMSKAAIERRAITILYDFQKARKVWGDLVSDGLTQANALVNVQLQQG